jgi:hypothetical protein
VNGHYTAMQNAASVAAQALETSQRSRLPSEIQR